MFIRRVTYLRAAGVIVSAMAAAVGLVAQAVDPLLDSQWHLKARSSEPAGANVRNVWPTTRGSGIVIGIVDDGLQRTHEDLQANFVASLSRDFNDGDTDPSPTSSDPHGTAVAGLAAARGDNGLGGSGVAPLASLAGLRLIAAPTGDDDEAAALAYELNSIQILSNSWGPSDNGRTLSGPGPLTAAALQNAATNGRNGRGRVFVWAAGNGRESLDDCNFDGYANSRFVIAVGALSDAGQQARYSEPCSALLVTAPSSGGSRALTTTDLTGSAGYSGSSYTSTFGGTSGATPVVSGIVALMLARNPLLTWRDVQHILVRSSVKVNASDSGWTSGSFPHNEKFGFGLVDASAAVNLAATWTNVAAEQSAPEVARMVNASIPDNDATGVTDGAAIGSAYSSFSVEHVEVEFSATHSFRGDLVVTLTSPSGVVSRLATARNDPGANFTGWRFRSVRHWGESAAGTWTLHVADAGRLDIGTWNNWTLRIYGTSGSSTSVPVITTQPSNQTVAAGGNATFTSSASGNPAPTYRWEISTTSGASWTSLTDTAPYSGVTTTSLAITGATSGLNGARYRMVATNSAGVAASNAARLSVSSPSVIAVDRPANGDTVTPPFSVSGWALNPTASAGTGVDAVHVWAFPSSGGATFLGAAAYGGARPDLGAIYGSQFTNSAYSLAVSTLSAGAYQIVAYAHNAATNSFDAAQSATITVGAAVSTPHASIDVPASGATVGPSFSVAGWGIDAGASGATGVDTVHVYAFPSSGSPMFLGSASYGFARPDVGAAFGSQFTNSGFSLSATGLPAGNYQLVAYFRSTVSGSFFSRVRPITVRQAGDPLLSIDAPTHNSSISRPFLVGGWAIDRDAASGTGVDTLHVWAFPAAGGSPVFLGVPAYGTTRSDVGAVFGSQFANSGYDLRVQSLAPGTYNIVVYAHSTVTGTFSASRVVTVTISP